MKKIAPLTKTRGLGILIIDTKPLFLVEVIMVEIAKRVIEIAIIKDLYEQNILTKDEMNLAISEIKKMSKKGESELCDL